MSDFFSIADLHMVFAAGHNDLMVKMVAFNVAMGGPDAREKAMDFCRELMATDVGELEDDLVEAMQELGSVYDFGPDDIIPALYPKQ